MLLLPTRSGIAAAVLAGCALITWAAEPPALIPWPASQDAASGVKTMTLKSVVATGASMALQGTVVLSPQQGDVVSMPVSGVVQALLVAPMQPVKAGQAVARVASSELAQRLRDWQTAEAQARLNKTRLQRDEALLAEGIIAESRVNEARAQHEMAALQAREHRQFLRMAGVGEQDLARAVAEGALPPTLTLNAPVSGTVMDVAVSPGQRLEMGSPVATIVKAGRWAIEVQASREQASKMQIGDTLLVEGCRSGARLTAQSPQVNAATQGQVWRAELAQPEACLRIHQFVNLRWQASSATGVKVPASALMMHRGRSHVLVRQAEAFRVVPVTVVGGSSSANGPEVSITQGLKGDETIAIEGVAAIKGAWLGLGPGNAAD